MPAEPAEQIYVGGLENRPVVLVDYQPGWVARFEAERTRIAAALGSAAVRVEHIGSTSIPGMAAKPIVDLQVAVQDLSDEGAFVGPLHAAGYHTRVRAPGEHWMFRTESLDVHVHVCAADGDFEIRHLLFRDWLRHDAADRARYQQAKRELAARDWPSVQHYAEAKGTVIGEIIERALAWAEESGWALPGPLA